MLRFLYNSIMGYMDYLKKEQVLDLFGGIVVELESVFRNAESLTEDEKLFIENRLLFLQMEYSRWVTRRDTNRKHPVSSPTTSHIVH